jgi:hypothetical protein
LQEKNVGFLNFYRINFGAVFKSGHFMQNVYNYTDVPVQRAILLAGFSVPAASDPGAMDRSRRVQKRCDPVWDRTALVP